MFPQARSRESPVRCHVPAAATAAKAATTTAASSSAAVTAAKAASSTGRSSPTASASSSEASSAHICWIGCLGRRRLLDASFGSVASQSVPHDSCKNELYCKASCKQKNLGWKESFALLFCCCCCCSDAGGWEGRAAVGCRFSPRPHRYFRADDDRRPVGPSKAIFFAWLSSGDQKISAGWSDRRQKVLLVSLMIRVSSCS
jgi:hypothetical protein